MNSFLEIKGLKNNNLDISISKNTISTFSGANNCGKTTLIRDIARILSKTHNKILLFENFCVIIIKKVKGYERQKGASVHNSI